MPKKSPSPRSRCSSRCRRKRARCARADGSKCWPQTRRAARA